MGILYVEEYKIDYNPEVAKKPELVVSSSKTQSFAGNYTVELLKTVNKFKVYLFLNIAENENDREFRKEVMKTVIDSDKFFNGVYANPIVKYLVSTLFSSAQFELKLPFKPVTVLLDLGSQNLNKKKLPGHLQVCELCGTRPTIPIQSDERYGSLQHSFHCKH